MEDTTIGRSPALRAPNLRCRSAARTDVGAVRAVNQDAYLDRRAIGLWAVADGLGGEMSGDRASAMIVESLGRVTSPSDASSFLAEVRDQLNTVNRALSLEAKETQSDRVIASTVVTFLVYGGNFACVWAGDSRLYLLRNQEFRQLTADHSEVQALIDKGLVDAREASSHPGANRLTRAVGAAQDLRLESRQDRIFAGDVFLLCSDGLTKMLDDGEIKERLQGREPNDAVESLIAATLARGAIDNVTVVVVCISEEHVDG